MTDPAKVAAQEGTRECIEVSAECAGVCLETVMYCLQQGGRHADPAHLRLLLDCAQLCQTNADFLRRDSELHYRLCEACAAVCTRCAQECEQFKNDWTMRLCANLCRVCAEECQALAAAATSLP